MSLSMTQLLLFSWVVCCCCGSEDLKPIAQYISSRMNSLYLDYNGNLRTNTTTLAMCDTCLPFGARYSPAIFNRITIVVARCLRQAGHYIMGYLDDTFVYGPVLTSSKATFDAFIFKLRNLRFQISWNKIVDHCQQLVFLGIQINTVTGRLSPKPERLSELCNLLNIFRKRKQTSRSQLESLAGKLFCASHVVPWGGAHLGSNYVLISCLQSPVHMCRLGTLQTDLTWWHYWLSNGGVVTYSWPHVYTGACTDLGGACYDGNLIYVHRAYYVPRLAPHRINTKELATIVMAAQAWSHVWANHHV